jgi:predicted ribonuclease YlaK
LSPRTSRPASRADSLGIKTEDFENQKVDADRLYTGYVTATVEGALIDELYRDRCWR